MRSIRIPRTRATAAAFAAILASLTFYGCVEADPIAPGSRRDTPWARMTPAQLQAAIAEADGKVFIGFKDPWESAGVSEEGVVLATPSSIMRGKALVRSLGIEITLTYGDMPAVAARMDAALLPQLRRDPLVEYVEPIVSGTRQ